MLRKSASPRRRVAAILLLALASTGAASASSAADPAPTASLQLSLAGVPQPGGLGAVTSTGSAATPGTVVIYLDQASSCAATPAAENMRVGAGQALRVSTRGVTGSFSFTSHFPTPAPGSYLLCGYLTDDSPTPAAVASTPLVVPAPGGPNPPPPAPPAPAPGPSPPPTGAPPAGSVSPPMLELLGGSISGTTVTIELSCQGAAGQVCSATAALSSNVRFRGSTPLAVAARRKQGKITTKRIIDATASYSAPAGTRTELKLRLNATAGHLLGRLKRLSSTLTLNGIPVDTVNFNVKTTKKKKGKKKKHHR